MRIRPGKRTAWGLLAAAAYFLPGCETMTQRRLKELDERYTQVIDRIAKGYEAQRAAEEKALELENARIQRLNLHNEAASRLASGDAKGAIENVDAALAAVKVKRKVAKKNDQENSTEDAEAYEEVLVEPPGMTPEERSRLLALKGSALIEMARNEEALQALQAAIQSDPENLLARRRLGRIHFMAKRFREAVDAWKPVLAAGARDGDLLAMLGESRQELARSEGRPEELHAARLAFEQVLLERPEDPEVLRWLADLAYETGRHDEAVRYLHAARAQIPFDAADLERLGNCHLALGEKARALDYLELAATMKPPTPELARTLGDLHAEARVPGRAAEWLARAYQQNPAEAPPEDRHRIGCLFADAGRDDEAAAWLSASGESEARHAESQARLVLLHAAAGRDDEALAAHEKVRRLPGAFGQAHAAAGVLYLERKQLETAADAFARAAGLPESKVDGLAGLAEVAYARGNLEGALHHYRQALAFRPGDARINAAVEQVAKEVALGKSNLPPPDRREGGTGRAAAGE